MKNYNFRSLFSTCAGISAMLLVAGASADGNPLPPVQYAGAISYIAGGIGSDESNAMKEEAGSYALSMIFADRIGDRNVYTTDVQLTIASAGGTSVLDIPSAGPLLLVNLPAGEYRVTATARGISKTRLVQVSAGSHRQLVFEWAPAAQA
jgi:hypothetical protein